ncbi:MAG: hypothetical protein GXY83_42095 [Rhodopirellula sp.]|nr:hypothetical protein [Rhodopirellula sp.]
MTIEQRVARLEEVTAELQRHIAPHEPVRQWLDRVSGGLKDYPEFKEVVRLGREIRQTYPSDTEA